MSAKWVDQEWDDLCERLNRCAEARDSRQLRQEVEQFTSQSAPGTYQEVLDRVREAADLVTAAASDDAATKSSPTDEKAPPFDPEHGVVDAIDEGGMESFPASDPSTHY